VRTLLHVGQAFLFGNRKKGGTVPLYDQTAHVVKVMVSRAESEKREQNIFGVIFR